MLHFPDIRRKKTDIFPTPFFECGNIEHRMLKVNIHNDPPRSRINRRRRLLLLVLVLFALYPILDAALDAYSDHLTHPLRMTPDDRMCSVRHHHTPKTTTFFQRVSFPAIDDPFFYFFKNRAIPAVAIKISQSCPPVSSDLSPPIV